ncbi:hypothetical protein [Aeromonas veronii]|nr:hypothetical protein [Aeromonas veronii]
MKTSRFSDTQIIAILKQAESPEPRAQSPEPRAQRIVGGAISAV